MAGRVKKVPARLLKLSPNPTPCPDEESVLLLLCSVPVLPSSNITVEDNSTGMEKILVSFPPDKGLPVLPLLFLDNWE